MRILDQKSDKSLTEILLCLTVEEAKEMRDSLNQLIKAEDKHLHISDENFDKEVTLYIYKDDNLDDELSDRVKALIENDK